MRSLRGFFFTLFLLTAFAAEATHLVGGFLSYRFLSRNGSNTRYRVTLNVYRDCSNDGNPDKRIPFDKTITLCVYKTNNELLTSFPVELQSEASVDPVGNVDCPELANACLKRGIYEVTIDVPNTSTGYKLKWERCCRNTQNNLLDDNGDPYQGQTYYGFIPASSLENSSPYFLDVPVPFICAKDTTNVRNRAVDRDGDSLSYTFVRPWQGASTSDPLPEICSEFYPGEVPVQYVGGFDQTKPFGNGGISQIDKLNGLTTYMAPNSGRYAVAIEVTEWRNGVKISTIRLDLQILVIDCKPNNKPRLVYQTNTTTWYVEAGAQICRDITIIDDKDNNDKVTIGGYGDMITGANGFKGTKATLSPAPATGTKSATTRFCWKTDCDHASSTPYILTFEGFDNGCPSKFVNENVLIYVTPFVPAEQPQGPVTVCQNSTGNVYSLKNLSLTNTYTWRVEGGTIVGDSTKPTVTVKWGTGTTGKVHVFIKSQYGCVVGPRTLNVSLIPAPPKPTISGKDTVCLNQSFIYNATAQAGVTFNWAAKGGAIIGANTNNNVNVRWSTKGDGFVTLTVTNSSGCSSEPDTFFVYVSHPTTPPIVGPNSICPNNVGIVYYVDPATKGSVYQWRITGGTQSSGALSGKITVDWGGKGTGMVKVVEIDRFGCVGDTVYKPVIIDHALAGQLPQGDTSICEFTKGMVYTIVPVNGETYNWIVTGGTIVSGQSTHRIVVDWGASGTGSVGVQSTAYDPVTNQPCLSPVRLRQVNIRPVPVKAFISGTFKICQNDVNGSFSISGFAGSTYEWEVVGRAFSGQGSNQIQVNLDTFGSFQIRVREITQYNCVGPWNDTVLIIHPKPRTSKIAGPDIICDPNLSNHDYSVTGFPNSVYAWTISGGVINSGATTNKVNVDWSGQQLSELTVTETSEFGCIGDGVKLDVFIDNPQIECRLVTVDPPPSSDEKVLVFYNLTNAPRYNQRVVIQRRVRGSTGTFGTVGTADPNAVMFEDVTALTDSFSYEYRAVAINLCGDSLYSNENTDILLRGSKTGPFSYKLNFTNYLTWPNGVARYELYRALENKSGYQLYQTYNLPATDNFDNGKEHFGMWFRIKAIENGGLNRESWSNDVRVYFEPLIFIPNAFTPDGSGLNDQFLPNSGGMKTYTLRIYNRWGEKLFETDNNEVGWDGSYLNKPAPMGIYVYVIDYSDYRNKQYQAKGTLHLMR